jgi:hypothetical protein
MMQVCRQKIQTLYLASPEDIAPFLFVLEACLESLPRGLHRFGTGVVHRAQPSWEDSAYVTGEVPVQDLNEGL